MEQLTLQQAAGNHSRRACVTHVELKRTAEEIDNIAFQAGAEWQKEQYKRVQELLKGIAEWAGNLPDEKLTTLTGAKDAALRGGKVADMRSIAVEAIRIFEPDYTPFEGYKHT